MDPYDRKLTVRVDEDLLWKIKEAAWHRKTTQSSWIRTVLRSVAEQTIEQAKKK